MGNPSLIDGASGLCDTTHKGGRMNLLRPALIAIALLTAASAASADGKIFSAADDVREPNQKALIWHEDGQETLIIQVRYEGGGNFAWVVPVPGRPKLDTAPSQLFFELAWITRPEIVPDREHRGMRGGGAGGVTVLETAQVGPYDTTTLAATDPNALADWLDHHGFRMPPDAPRVLRSYTKRGWYYVALRIDLERRRGDLLRDLRALRPDVTSLDTAANTLTNYFMDAASRGDAHARNELAAVFEVLLSYGPDGPPGGWWGDFSHDYRRNYKRTILYQYDSAVAHPDTSHFDSVLLETVRSAVDATESALDSGAIAPLRLDFPSEKPVYPLYLTSLNGGPTDIQLYFLGPHRATADAFPQFRTSFARRFSQAALTPFPATRQVMTPNRSYLTELRATLSPAEMTSDLTFGRARTDIEFREKTFSDGTPAIEIPSAGAGLPARIVPPAAAVFLLLLAAYTLHRLRRRA